MIGSLLSQALDLHRQGRLDDAEQAYAAILARFPDDPDALHLAGVLARQKGRPGQAVELIRRALAQAPAMGDAYFNLGNALVDLGRLDDAADSYRQSLALDPDQPDIEARLVQINWALRQARLKATLDEQYDAGKWAYLADSPSECARFGVVAAYVRQACERGAVLDLGAGEGTLYRMLQPGHRDGYVGVDISEKALAGARRRGLDRPLFCAPLEVFDPQAMGAGTVFDVIVFSEVLLYVDDPASVLDRYARWLAPSGHVVASWYSMKGEFGRKEARFWDCAGQRGWQVVDGVELRHQVQSNLVWTIKLLARPVD